MAWPCWPLTTVAKAEPPGKNGRPTTTRGVVDMARFASGRGTTFWLVAAGAVLFAVVIVLLVLYGGGSGPSGGGGGY